MKTCPNAQNEQITRLKETISLMKKRLVGIELHPIAMDNQYIAIHNLEKELLKLELP